MNHEHHDQHHHHTSGTGSTAAIAQHPLHPILVVFPIAFLVGALAADLAFARNGDAFWARGAFWLIAAGLAVGVLAAIPGAIDLPTLAHARGFPLAWVHAGLNVAALAIALVNILVRGGDHAARVVPLGLGLSIVTTLLLLVSGWLGGEMTYRHGIGVAKMVGEHHTGHPSSGHDA